MKQKQDNLQPVKKLVLHFDLNKTLLIVDKAIGQDKENCLNDILSNYAWGKIEQKDEKSPIQWKLYCLHFQSKPPEQDQISYKSYVQSLYPKKLSKDEPDEKLRKQYNDKMHELCQELYNNFVKAGGPGTKLKPEYDKLLKQISLPKLVGEDIKNQLKKYEEDGINIETPANFGEEKITGIIDLFKDGKYYILPAFYRMILNLKKQKREFAIIFRTFGNDLSNVIREINKFCQGEHPCFNGKNNTPLARFDGSKGTKNYIINDLHTGLFYRQDSDINKLIFVNGTLRRAAQGKSLEDEYEKEIEDDNIFIHKGANQAFVAINELLKDRCCLAIQDDYQTWNNNNEKVLFAKPLLIDPTDYFTQHIFFDDNIAEDDDCIVDVREILGGTAIPIKKSLNKYMVKVDIVDLLKDPDFFITQIQQCEKARAEEIEKIEKGISDEVEDQQKKTEFEIFQELSDQEYLRKTILPLLHPALKLIDIERPNDPISFIAQYCLKNQNKVKIPQPTAEYLEKLKEKEEQAIAEHQEAQENTAISQQQIQQAQVKEPEKQPEKSKDDKNKIKK